MTTLLDSDIESLIAMAAKKAMGVGMDASVARDDLATWLALRSAMAADPALGHLVEREMLGKDEPWSMSEWVRRQAVAALRQPPRGPKDHLVIRQGWPGESALIEERDTTTTVLGSLVPPGILVQQWAPTAGPRPAIDNLATSWPWDGGSSMTLVQPRTTTPPTVVAQGATQGVNQTSTDMVATDVTLQVATLETAALVSRQAVERQAGTTEATAAEVATALRRQQDSQFLTGAGTNASMTGLLNQTGLISVTNASATAAGQVSSLLNAAQQVAVACGAPVEQVAAVVHPRRLAFWLAATSSTREVGGAVYLSGLKVVSDPNIRTNLGAGTNEDECWLAHPPNVGWLEATQAWTFEQHASTGSVSQVRVATWSRCAVVTRFAGAAARVSGALLPPTF